MTREVCGVESFCGRPPGHAGRHGFVQVPNHQNLGYEPQGEPSERQLEVLAEVLLHGDHASAAHCLGIATNTVKNTVYGAIHRIGAVDSRQASVLLGWTVIPADLAPHHRETP